MPHFWSFHDDLAEEERHQIPTFTDKWRYGGPQTQEPPFYGFCGLKNELFLGSISIGLCHEKVPQILVLFKKENLLGK